MRLAGSVIVVVPLHGELTQAIVAALEREGASVVSAELGERDAFGLAVRAHGRVDGVVLTDPAVAVEWLGPAGAALAARGGGSITTLVTTRALAGDVRGWDEAARGGAAVALTLAAATTYGHEGVRANAVAVPPPDLDGECVARSTLLPRAFEPSDAAALVVFLASTDAAFVTGQCLRCDGGLLAHLPHYASLVASGTTTTGG